MIHPMLVQDRFSAHFGRDISTAAARGAKWRCGDTLPGRARYIPIDPGIRRTFETGRSETMPAAFRPDAIEMGAIEMGADPISGHGSSPNVGRSSFRTARRFSALHRPPGRRGAASARREQVPLRHGAGRKLPSGLELRGPSGPRRALDPVGRRRRKSRARAS